MGGFPPGGGAGTSPRSSLVPTTAAAGPAPVARGGPARRGRAPGDSAAGPTDYVVTHVNHTDSVPAPGAGPRMIDARQRRIGFLVAGCMFMEILDGTIVSTAAPRIGAALHVPAASIGLVVTAYLITLAMLIPLSGWMVSRYGTRRVFLTAIVVFTTASLLCSTSTSIGELVAWRVLQGVGGAMMVPVGRLAVLGTTAKSDLMRMISYIVWPALIAPVIAPLAGGLITTYASWHWLFLINVPLGAIAFAVAIRLIPSLPQAKPPRLDWAGVVLTGLALGRLTYAASLLAQPAPPWVTVAAVAVPATGLLILALRHLLRVPDPLVDLRTLRIPTFRLAIPAG